MMKRSHLVAHKDSFDGNVQVLAPVNQIKFDQPTHQLLKKGGGLMCIPFAPFGGGGSPTCSPFPNKCPIISIAKGTPMDRSFPRNPLSCAVPLPRTTPLPMGKFSTASFSVWGTSLEQVCGASLRF